MARSPKSIYGTKWKQVNVRLSHISDEGFRLTQCLLWCVDSIGRRKFGG